tara:strand:- start:237 stop:341 length:105 start_codon:yes stop_codon:yes gene_type:complete
MDELLTFLIGVSPILFIMFSTLAVAAYTVRKRRR